MLIAKLHTHDLDTDSLNILQDCLSNRKQRIKVDSFYSSWEAILSGVPEGSILGPLLFDIFMCHMFLILNATYFTGYADDSTPFVVRDNIADVAKALEEIWEDLLNWLDLLNCPLVWMCCNRSLNAKINRLHERRLWIVYNDKQSSFTELLVKDGSVSIHHQNLQNWQVKCLNFLEVSVQKLLMHHFNPDSKYLTN